MINLSSTIIDEIRAHAKGCFPRESCGLVMVWKGRQRYVPIRNIAEKNEHFVMHSQDQADVEDRGEVLMVVHSHPNVAATPSQADLVECEKTGLPWLIVNWPTGVIHQFEPRGYKAPLYGRQFSHGTLDCYSFIQDYYREILQINLPNVDRPDEWWLKGGNLYLQGFEAAGFTVVQGLPQKHDGLLMQVGSTVPNHGAIYLGDGCIGHHQMGRLSSRDVWGGWFRKVTTHVVRHKEFLK